jgi:membrane fusion protein, multidrug efflux system
MIDKDTAGERVKKVSEYVANNKYILKLAGTLLLVMFLTAQIRGCMERNQRPPVHPRPVKIAEAFEKDVPLYLRSFGTMYSPGDIDIKSQVTGKILEVGFRQGDEVSEGDLLFVVDPAPYVAELDRAKAALSENKINMQLKLDTLERNRRLFEKDLISEQEFEQYHTEATAAVAKVELEKANVESAEINLEYCSIVSPIDGITGKRQVDAGNIVSANTGPTLVNVRIFSDLYIDFTLPERDLVPVREAMKNGPLKVLITVPGEEENTFQGKLDLIDNTIDEATGTFALRASIKNDERALWPGQFVNVKLILTMQKDAVLVPYAAPQIGKEGHYVFVISRGNKADLRQVKLGSRQDEYVVVKEGVKTGESVVVEGQMGLAPGIPVVDVGGKNQKTPKRGILGARSGK